MQSPTVVVVATLDTKGVDAAFVRDLILEKGLATLLVDVGVLGDITVTPDIGREEIAEYAGTTLAELIDTKDKGLTITTQSAGLVALV
ncbi:MAG: Tm-1-like ATP-binding domain-containing protein, partial [Rhodospirillales bacterium]|nr:Tm-1-like ATP-binding domain-containing protein [Rhodospirillales bacterium]